MLAGDDGLVSVPLGGEACQHIHQGIVGITEMAIRDGRPDDVTIVVAGGEGGITIHCDTDPSLGAVNA